MESATFASPDYPDYATEAELSEPMDLTPHRLEEDLALIEGSLKGMMAVCAKLKAERDELRRGILKLYIDGFLGTVQAEGLLGKSAVQAAMAEKVKAANG